MCLVIFAHRCHPDYPLLLAANRDEFYARPTLPARFRPQHPGLLAGLDQQAGGTWMGITRDGRFAAITNYRDPDRSEAAPRSRGELTMDFLLGSDSPRSYLQQLAPRAGEYAGFNLLLGAGGELWHYSNSDGDAGAHRLEPGIYGLSNALLNTPWPKSELGKARMAQALEALPPSHEGLLQVVADRGTADREQLHPLGLEQAMDELLSAQFITAGEYGYGTRSSTTLWLTAAGEVAWCERLFDEAGVETGRHAEAFPVSG